MRNLRTRSALLRAVRDFFYAGEFLEIETPVKIPAPAPEEYIESVTAGNGEFLRTSPELAMKELLSLGVEVKSRSYYFQDKLCITIAIEER